MSIETVHAIVLRRRDAGESDRRLTLLTQEVGVIDVVAKGARKAGSRLSGCSEPLTACILGLAPGKRIQYVTQAQPVSAFPGLRNDYDRLACGLALGELAAVCLSPDLPAEEEFRHMARALAYLEVHEEPLTCLIWAQSKLMALMGFRPSFSHRIGTATPIALKTEFVSPQAGGVIEPESERQFPDRFLVRIEALVGAAKIVDLEAPPPHLRFANEVFGALYRFWEHMTDHKLPASAAILASLHDSS